MKLLDENQMMVKNFGGVSKTNTNFGGKNERKPQPPPLEIILYKGV